MKKSTLTSTVIRIVLLSFALLSIALATEPSFKNPEIDSAQSCFSNSHKALLQDARKAVVTISSNISISAYSKQGTWTGTGFIVDKQKGLILTNSHVTGKASLGEYTVTFHTGQEADAKLLYYDLWQDFAILKVDRENIPEETNEIIFSNEKPKLNESVFIIGNNEGQGFSIHKGTLSDLHSINGQMPQDSYIINLNSVGGSSGSPLLNKQGKAIGLHYGGGDTFGISLKGEYVKDTLRTLRLGKKIKRQHIGILTKLYSLNKAAKFLKFPKEETNSYIKDFPDARNRAIIVQSTIAGSPAENELQAGDIIWQVGNIKIGPSLYELDRLMNQATNEITLTIYRQGKKIIKKIKLYDVNAHKIKKMVEIKNDVFFESDDVSSTKSGAPLSGLTIFNPYGEIEYIKHSKAIIPLTFGDYQLTSIENLIDATPKIIAKKHTTIEYKDLLPRNDYFGAWMISRDRLSQEITFTDFDRCFKILVYDPNKWEWHMNHKCIGSFDQSY